MTKLKHSYIPLGTLVAIKVFKVKETRGGVLIPETANAHAYDTPSAEVLAIGPKCEQVKVGDIVKAPDGTPIAAIRHEGDEFHVVDEKFLAVIVQPE
jgi:co-chaperonin GroES (HSP10)